MVKFFPIKKVTVRKYGKIFPPINPNRKKKSQKSKQKDTYPKWTVAPNPTHAVARRTSQFSAAVKKKEMVTFQREIQKKSVLSKKECDDLPWIATTFEHSTKPCRTHSNWASYSHIRQSAHKNLPKLESIRAEKTVDSGNCRTRDIFATTRIISMIAMFFAKKSKSVKQSRTVSFSKSLSASSIVGHPFADPFWNFTRNHL